jgi:O-antigen ligase
MGGGATGRPYRLGSVSSGLRSRAKPEAVFLLVGLLAFALVPGYLGAALSLAAFAALAFAAPYLSLLTLLGALPLHFVLRRPFAGIDLSLPDAVLLATAVGLLAAVYWKALLSGSAGLKSILRRVVRGPYFWPTLLLVGMGTLTLLFLTPGTRRGLIIGLRAYSILVEPIAVYAIAVMTLRGHGNRLRLALDVLFATAVLVSLAGMVEAVDYALHPRPEVGGYHRVDSLFNHPNSLALYLTRTLPLFGSLALALPAAEKRRRLVYLGGAVLMGVAMLLSGSRGGWLAVAAAALLVGALAGRWRWLLPAGAVAAGGVALLVLTGENRLSSLFYSGRGSANTRQRLWKAAVEEIGKSPLWGTGLGNVRWMRRYIPQKRLVGTELIDAHNLFLDFWSKLGIVGLLAILWLVGRFYHLAVRAFRRGDETTRAVALGLLAAMSAALVHGLVDAFYFNVQLAVMFWLMLGIAEVLATDPDA